MTQRHANNNSHSHPRDFLILGEPFCAASHTEHNQNCCHGHQYFDACAPRSQFGTTAHVVVHCGIDSAFQFAGATPGDKAATVSLPPAPAVVANFSVSQSVRPRETAAVTDLFHRQRMTVADNSVWPHLPNHKQQHPEHREHDQSIAHEVSL